MDDFDNLIEKYRRELIELSKNNPIAEESTETSTASEEEAVSAASVNIITNDKIENTEECCSEAGNPTVETNEIKETESASTAPVEVEPLTRVADNEQVSTYVAPQFADYDEFLKNNPQSGSLKVQVYAANQAFPIPNARVTVVLELLNGSREMFDGLTDINGIIDNIKLPAPDAEMSQAPSNTGVLPYSTYTTYIEHPDFVNEKFTNVPVFPGIKSIQGVELISRVNYGNQPESIVQNEGESFARLKGVD